MDPAHVFRQGLGSIPPRQHYSQALPLPRRLPTARDDLSDEHADGSSARIAHTLTACCRCRQRKTRCDPTLPRCLPCERSGSVCEYLDTTKGRKINRNYVILLQNKVRDLEAELGQYVDEDGDYPHSSEDIVRPGGMISLGGADAGDETPRYLGPSSGIAMTRLLMEEAKRYTESNRISDLIPELHARRQARMQSIQMTVPSLSRKRSYPMTSEHPAERLVERGIADKLVELFKQRAQIFWPVLHEMSFQMDLDAVYNGDCDAYKLFVVRMVLAIGLQKFGDQYAGLADSYYLAAMQDFETILRPKDLKTLQCVVLVSQYSLLTPTRVPTYYLIGLAAKICQQEGLVYEKTITTGYSLDPQIIDMRRRLVWIVASMELGLAHSLGRPNNFATGDEQLDVKFFATVDDEHITEHGIASGPISDQKLVAIHFYKMRALQAEIRRTLYERKTPEPKDDTNPWYQQMDTRLRDWIDAAPKSPEWTKPWFASRYHQMRISMYRPSPQISKPSPEAVKICYESSKFIIDLSNKEMDSNFRDITWVFILVLNMALNTLLWSTSYTEVRQSHPRMEVEELVEASLNLLDRCAERWPGTANSSELYAIFSKACLQSYETNGHQPNSILTTPPAAPRAIQPDDSQIPPHANSQQLPYLHPPQFGQVFNSPPEAMNTYAFDPNFPPPHPTFRSNSIFQDPGITDTHGRRFSYFPPDFTQLDDAAAPDDTTPPSTTPDQYLGSPSEQKPYIQPLTPPESQSNISSAVTTSSPPNMLAVHARVQPAAGVSSTIPPPTKYNQAQPQAMQRIPPYLAPGMSRPTPQQRPLPQQPPSTTATNWLNPPAPMISAYNFGAGSNFYNDTFPVPNVFSDLSGSGLGLGFGQGGPHFNHHSGRHGSLSQTQQLELMNVLETEGMGDIDAYLNSGNVPVGRWY